MYQLDAAQKVEAAHTGPKSGRSRFRKFAAPLAIVAGTLSLGGCAAPVIGAITVSQLSTAAGIASSIMSGRDLTEQNQLPLLLPGGLTADPKVGQVVNLINGELTESYQQPLESPSPTAETVSSPPLDSEDASDGRVTD